MLKKVELSLTRLICPFSREHHLDPHGLDFPGHEEHWRAGSDGRGVVRLHHSHNLRVQFVFTLNRSRSLTTRPLERTLLSLESDSQLPTPCKFVALSTVGHHQIDLLGQR